MRDTAERLATATDTTAVAETIADHAARTIGYGSFSFVPFVPGLVDPAAFVVRSSEFTPALMRRSLPGMIVAAERELRGIGDYGLGSFDLAERFPRARLEYTSVFQDYWRPLKLERQLVTFMGRGPEKLGFFCIARSGREREFAPRHLQVMEELREHAERSLAAIRRLGSDDLACTLDALARAFPSPAYLFDVNGRLHWMSEDGALRLSIESARVGARGSCRAAARWTSSRVSLPRSRRVALHVINARSTGTAFFVEANGSSSAASSTAEDVCCLWFSSRHQRFRLGTTRLFR